MDSAELQASSEANRLYWSTELPVSDIAAQLDLSRRALYDAIQPVPAPGHCGRCGGDLQFANRSSRVHGFATCRSCGLQAQPVEAPEPEPWTWSPQSRAATMLEGAEPSQSIWWLGAAALTGALLGAGLTLGLVRRR